MVYFIVCAILTIAPHLAAASIFDIFGPAPAAKAVVQGKKPSKPRPVEKAPKAPESKPTFTITKIEPKVKEETIKIYFTDSVTTAALENNLRVFPPVSFEWYNSNISTGNVVTLKGSFRPGQSYMLSLPEDFMSANGKQFVKGVVAFNVPDLPSEIALPEKGTIIERDGRQLLNMNVTNADEVVFRGLQVPALLLPAALEQARSKNVKPWDNVKADLQARLAQVKDAVAGDPDLSPLAADIYEDRDAFITGKEHNKSHIFSMPLEFRHEKEKGSIELVRIDSRKKEQAAEGINQVLCVTDTGISYKVSGSAILVWTTSLRTGKAAPGAPIILFGRDNTAFFAGRTDGNGLLSIQGGTRLKALSLNNPVQGISMREVELKNIVFAAAAPAGDAAFIEVKPTGNISLADVKQSSAVVKDEVLRNGLVFTERGVYRPGETVFFKGTVREYKKSMITPPEGLECRFAIQDPHGDQVYEKKIKLSEFGTASDSFKAEKYMPVGTYTLTMSYGQGVHGKTLTGRTGTPADDGNEGDDGDEGDDGQYRRGRQPKAIEGTENTTFQVQEFQPPRHFTRISFKRTMKDEPGFINIKKTNEYVACTVEGRYYAGGPVKNGRVRWIARKSKTNYERADYPDYSFGYPDEVKGDVLESGESVLDSTGKVEVLMPISGDVVSGMLGIQFEATVVDFDGRAASGSSVYQAESDYLVGISNHPASVKSDDPISLRGVVIDKAGKRVESGTMQVKVMERSGTSFPKRNAAGNVYWEYQEIWRDRLSTEIPIKNGEALFDFDFTWGGRFIVTFAYKTEDGRRYSSGTPFSVDYYGYYYNYNEENNTTTPSERLNLISDKAAYSPGETAKIYFSKRKPFETALVTVERSGVMQSKVITVSPEQKYIELPITDDYYPNVYISVLGTLPRGDFPMYKEEFDSGAPGFVFGAINIDVKRETGGITVTINPKQKKMQSLPGAEVTLDLHCRDIEGRGVASEVAVCVVDESVLALTGFKTPRLDQINRFSGPLSVFTGDIRKELLRQTLYDMLKVVPLTGGDGSEMARLSKKLRSDFSPVAYFNPAVRTDEDGNATVSFKFPDTMTEYRIYAVACDKGSRFGSGEKSAVVVKEFYMEPGLPRFFTKGDKFHFNVSAFNRSDAAGELAFGVEADDRLTVSADNPSLKLGANDNVMAGITGKASKPGRSKLTFTGKLGQLEDAVQVSVPVNSGYIIENDSLFGSFKGNTAITYHFPNGASKISDDDINPEEAQAVLTISGSPFIRLAPALKYLLGYPYGCIEQTSSKVLALSGLRGLIKQGMIPGITVEETDKFLKPGTERLISMQVESGGFSYWPGETSPHPWGSIYATYALTLNMQAGMDVPRDRLNKALDYISQTANGEASGDTTFKAYAAYVLSLNGRFDQALVKNINEALIKQQNREAAVVTWLAVKASGTMTPELKSLARLAFEKTRKSEPAYRGWHDFYAPYRSEALELLAASEILPGERASDDAAKNLMAGMQKGIWTSTSDTGWSLIALGSYFKGAKFGAGPVNGKVLQGGKTIAEFNIKPTESFTVSLDYLNFLREPNVEVSTVQQTSLLYKLSLSYPRMDYAAKGYSKGFEVTKDIKNLDGSDRIRVGDVVEVKVRVTTGNTDNNYLVIDDPLPAGLVAINSALKTEEHIEKSAGAEREDDEAYWWSYWEKDGYYRLVPSYMEMRDDRVLVFRNYLWKGTYQYSYYARAVCEGDFNMPPTKVQLMYQPEKAGYTPAGKIHIEGNR